MLDLAQQRDKVFLALEGQLSTFLPDGRSSCWLLLRDKAKVYPFTLHYLLQAQDHLKWHDDREQLSREIEGMSTWSFKDAVVRHEKVRNSIIRVQSRMETIASTGVKQQTSVFIAWYRAIHYAMDCDISDLEYSMRNAILKREIPSESFVFWELQPFMDVLLSLIERSEKSRRLFERYLHSLIVKTGAIPEYLFVNDVARIGNNPYGGGGFSDVWKGVIRSTGQIVALKVLREFQQTSLKSHENVLREVTKESMIWRRLSHPNILPFYGICGSTFHPRLAMVSPWMENENVLCYLQNNQDADRRQLVNGIALGMHYLHTLDPPVIHGDLRGANVLVDEFGVAKLADFGLASILDSRSSIFTSAASYKGNGPMRWQAPELLYSDLFPDVKPGTSTNSDVYAFAAVCLEIFTEKAPFPHLRDVEVIFAVTIKKMQHPRPDSGATEKGLTDDLWLLMQECWTRYPSQRPGMDVVVKRLGAVEAEIGAVIPELEILKLPKTLDTLSLPTSLRILPHLCGELKRQVASTVTMPLKTVKTPSGSYTLYDECGEGIRFVSFLVGSASRPGYEFKFKQLKIDVSETEYVEFKALLVQLYISVFDLVDFLPVLHDMSISTRHESILIIRILKLLRYQRHLFLLPGSPYIIDAKGLNALNHRIHALVNKFIDKLTHISVSKILSVAYECLCTVSVEDSISITGELHVPKADSKASGKRSIATSKKTATKINLSLSSGVRRRKGIRTASSSWKVYRKKMQVSNILRTSKR